MMQWSFSQRVQRGLTRSILKRAMRVTVQGLENVPKSGPYILVWNHLHISDGMLLWSSVLAPTVFLATDKFRGKNRLVHAYLRGTGAILVRYGTVDRQAIKRALQALEEGSPIAIAPEGRVSQTGALCEAEPGVASLVCHSGVPVVPVAIWGQHRAHEAWMRFKRPRCTMRYGEPQTYPRVPATAANLRRVTTDIMRGLARTLPAEYRGVYSDCEESEDVLCG